MKFKLTLGPASSYIWTAVGSIAVTGTRYTHNFFLGILLYLVILVCYGEAYQGFQRKWRRK